MRHLVVFLLLILLASGTGCARTDWIDRTLVTENVTGTWSGSFGEAASFRFVQLDLQHQGPNVTGFIGLLPSGSSTGYQDRRAPIEGSVAGDVFTFKDARGSFSGELTIAGDEMTGRIFGPQGTRQVSLRRANLPSEPNPPPR
jgi:hypothetical protein